MKAVIVFIHKMEYDNIDDLQVDALDMLDKLPPNTTANIYPQGDEYISISKEAVSGRTE